MGGKMTITEQKRRELLTIMESYLEALIEKDVKGIPVAAGVKVTYNGEITRIGENELWRNTLIIKERQTFVDPDEGQMVFFGIFSNEQFERDQIFPIDVNLYAMFYTATIRLKVKDHEIVEVEELACSKRLRYFMAEKWDIRLPDLYFKIPIPEEEQSTRKEMIDIIDIYWDCAAKWQPAENMLVHPDAQRYEEGFRTTNHTRSFRGDFKHNPNFTWDTTHRRYPVIDTTRGVIVSYCMMDRKDTKESDGRRGALVVEAFRIENGSICHLMAFFPFLTGQIGWENE
jgi:hypothetical protein